MAIVCQLAEEKLTKTVSFEYTSRQQTWERKELNGDCEMFVGDFTRMGNEQLLMLMRTTGIVVVPVLCSRCGCLLFRNR